MERVRSSKTSDCSGAKTGPTACSSIPLAGSPTIFRSYKTELDPTKTQIQRFLNCSGAARFVYNLALEARIVEYKGTGKSPSFYDQCKQFVQLKHQMLPWLKEISSWVVQGALLDLDCAFKNFFRRVKQGKDKPGFPKFKSRAKGIGGFRFFNQIRVEERRIRLPKIGWVRLKERDYLPTEGVKVKQAAVSERAGHWFVSLLVEEPHVAEKVTGPVVGVDLGIKTLATCSDGRTFQNPKAVYRHQKKLARLQRELARRQKGGKNREKTKEKLARCHYRIASIRSNAIHNATANITARAKPCDERPSCIVVEDLNVAGMMKNHHLARAVADAGMAEFRRQVEYKAAWLGIDLVVADRFYPSSKTCSACGYKKPLLKLSEREFVCEKCGAVIERDLNAAKNLAALSTASSAETYNACGEDVRPTTPSESDAASLRQELMHAHVGTDAAGH